jgi:hypothetical protein
MLLFEGFLDEGGLGGRCRGVPDFDRKLVDSSFGGVGEDNGSFPQIFEFPNFAFPGALV